MFDEEKNNSNNTEEKAESNTRPIIEESNGVDNSLPFSEPAEKNNFKENREQNVNLKKTNKNKKEFSPEYSTNEKSLIKKIPWKLVAIIGGLVLIIGGFCAVYFTNIKYKLPFFQAEESELVGMMYERIKEFKSSDFSMNFLVEVADRTDKFSRSEKKSNFDIKLINPAKAITSYTIEDITANIGLDKANENTNTADSDVLSFFSGESLEEYWQVIGMYLSGGSKINLTVSGSGFDLSKVKEIKELPDVEMAIKGDFKMGSMTMLIDLAGKLVKDNLYYKVSEFPYIDITQGHQGEWIKASSNNETIDDFVGNIEEKGDEFINKARDFISKTREKKLLIFTETGNKINIEGIEAPEFEIEVNSEVVPDWIKSIQNDNSNTNISEVIDIGEKELTKEEKNEIKQRLEKAMENIRIRVALHPGTGELMQLSFNSRIVPPENVKVYKDKQINMGFTVKMWNHNNPSGVKAPSSYVDADEIEREKLGLSKEAFRDRKQAERILSIREKLMEYYIENKKFPDKFSKVTSNTKDLNTEKDYIYEVKGNNYSLEYNMNDVEQEPSSSEEENTSGGVGLFDLAAGYTDYNKKGIGVNNITHEKNEWKKGKNIADRYSPIADQVKEKSDFVKDEVEKTNYDVLVAKEQAEIISYTKILLTRYKTKYETFPETISKLEEAVNNNEIYSGISYYNKRHGYICEDLLTGEVCQYTTENNNKAYKIDINFPLGIENISSEASSSFRYSLEEFESGKNTFTGGISIINTNTNINTSNINWDSDSDGLSDYEEQIIGTNKKNKDTDGDGYNDSQEYFGGYNPLGSGKAVKGYWSKCIDLSVSTYKNCNEYCKSIGKICSKGDVMLQEYNEYTGGKQWVNESMCEKRESSLAFIGCDGVDHENSNETVFRCFCK